MNRSLRRETLLRKTCKKTQIERNDRCDAIRGDLEAEKLDGIVLDNLLKHVYIDLDLLLGNLDHFLFLFDSFHAFQMLGLVITILESYLLDFVLDLELRDGVCGSQYFLIVL